MATVGMQKRLEIAQNVDAFMKRLRDPTGKQGGDVTEFISQNKSRQEFVPSVGKYVDSSKAEQLHNTNNAWQHWFSLALGIAMEYTNERNLKSATAVADFPITSPLVSFLSCVKETLKCGRLHKNFLRWFSEERKKGIPFLYRITHLKLKSNITPKKSVKSLPAPGAFFSVYYYTFYNSVI